MSYLRYLCLFAYSGVQHILCCVFVLLFFIWCTLCCQFLWIVHFDCLFAILSGLLCHVYSDENKFNNILET